CRYRFENADTMPAMAAESAAKPSETRSTRNSIAMPPSWKVDQAPYESSRAPVPVALYTMRATDKVVHAIIIEPAAREPVHRSGNGLLRSDPQPSSANRTAGDPTPTSTSHPRETLGITPKLLRRTRWVVSARSQRAKGIRVCPDTKRKTRP